MNEDAPHLSVGQKMLRVQLHTAGPSDLRGALDVVPRRNHACPPRRKAIALVLVEHHLQPFPSGSALLLGPSDSSIAIARDSE